MGGNVSIEITEIHFLLKSELEILYEIEKIKIKYWTLYVENVQGGQPRAETSCGRSGVDFHSS